jgi:hypothetical protein
MEPADQVVANAWLQSECVAAGGGGVCLCIYVCLDTGSVCVGGGLECVTSTQAGVLWLGGYRGCQGKGACMGPAGPTGGQCLAAE